MSNPHNLPLPAARVLRSALTGLVAVLLVAALAGPAGAADRRLAAASQTDATGGASAYMELWQRDSDGAVYPKVWITDTKADGICAHAALRWAHVNGTNIPEYGSWVCGDNQKKGPFVWGARNWREYRSVSLSAFVDNGAPSTRPVYDFAASPPTFEQGPTFTPVVNRKPADVRRPDTGGSPARYAALGDSYSSGTGTADFDWEDDCHQTLFAYPAWVARHVVGRGGRWVMNACHGALTDDVTNKQLRGLGARTELVTISIGGNDAGFRDVLTTCGYPSAPGGRSDCHELIRKQLKFVEGTLPGKLRRLYEQIASKAPNARVVVAGYPHLFDDDCHPLTTFNAGERAAINRAADRLDTTIAGVVHDFAGFQFVDPRKAFDGHLVCAGAQAWLNNYIQDAEEDSFHPNVNGHYGYYQLIRDALRKPKTGLGGGR